MASCCLPPEIILSEVLQQQQQQQQPSEQPKVDDGGNGSPPVGSSSLKCKEEKETLMEEVEANTTTTNNTATATHDMEHAEDEKKEEDQQHHVKDGIEVIVDAVDNTSSANSSTVETDAASSQRHDDLDEDGGDSDQPPVNKNNSKKRKVAHEHANLDLNSDVKDDNEQGNNDMSNDQEDGSKETNNDGTVDNEPLVSATSPPTNVNDDAPVCGLVMPEDLELVSERAHFMMQQFIPSTNSSSMKKGICCRFCHGYISGGKHYASTAKSLLSNFSYIERHAQACFPEEIYKEMMQLNRDDPNPGGSRSTFFERIFNRAHAMESSLITTPRCQAASASKSLSIKPRGKPTPRAASHDSATAGPSSNKSSVQQRRVKPKMSTSPSAGGGSRRPARVFLTHKASPETAAASWEPKKGPPKKTRPAALSQDPPHLCRQEGPMLLLENDPNDEFYIEERAFLYHDPKETSGEAPNEEPVTTRSALKPLPPPQAPPTEADFPKNSLVVWKYIEEERVLLCDFSKVADERHLAHADVDFLASMFERDDITCISQGLLDPAKVDEYLWDMKAIRQNIGRRMHFFFKRFRQEGEAWSYVAMPGMLEMTFEQYFKYLDCRRAAMEKDNSDDNAGTDTKLVIPSTTPGQPLLELDVVKDVIYMIDLDMAKFLPRTFDDFVGNFKMKEILPGGKWCMMNALPSNSRPFMGPNVYITPGGGFTQMHQDGHGTVDSGHIALSGYNEVLMLRRLPERHKVEACKDLPNVMDKKGNRYDGMYGLPHDQCVGHGWPTKDTITHWKSMNYCPSVFILKEGQHVHINKGRLHAFRKLTPQTLPENDCHFDLRDALIKETGLSPTALPTCISIAWDWQFSGVHAEGVHRETVSTLESAMLVDKKDGCKCLAIPKASLLAMARQIRPKSHQQETTTDAPASLLGASMVSQGVGCDTRRLAIDNTSLARGMLPALRFLVQSSAQVSQMVNASAANNDAKIYKGKVSIAPGTDCDEYGTVEPDGPDYFCKMCHSELENLYFHCDGCEMHLHKDFNICVDCHRDKKWKCKIQMCPTDSERKATINHTGDMPNQESSRCPCRRGKACGVCGLCSACSCICHTCFTLHRRFYDEDTLNEVLRRVEEIVSDPVEHSEYTEARLLCAADRNGAGLVAKRLHLAEHPKNKAQSLKLNADKRDHDVSEVSEKEQPIELVAGERDQVTDMSAVNLTAASRLESHNNTEDDRIMPAVDIDRKALTAPLHQSGSEYDEADCTSEQSDPQYLIV